MFGLGFTEILLIAVVALLFIGPDKLPDTMRNIARTLGRIKRALDDTKSTLEQELRVDDLRAEVMQYRAELEKAKSDLSAFKNIAAKEANSIKSEVAKLENSYQPTDINDDKLFDDLFEEAERDFEELEKPKPKDDKKIEHNSGFKNAPKTTKEESNKNKPNILNNKVATGFKHLDKKDA